MNTFQNIKEKIESGSSLLDAVGHTPLLPLQRITRHLPPAVRVLAKAEWLNPAGSVKDRPASRIIRDALETGELGNGKTLLDSTSGNMGISYASFGAALGLSVTLSIIANASPERLAILRALGADLHLSDPLEGFDGAIHQAREMAAKEPDKYHYVNQYSNSSNWHAHFESTGPEIWEQSKGEVTHFVVGLGTTGTLMGAGRYLREQNAGVKIVAVQPDTPLHGMEGLKHMPSALQPQIFDPEFADENRIVNTDEAYKMTRRLGRDEGLFVGVSSGAATAVALKVAEELQEGTVVTIFPDAGYKYLNDSFWSQGQ